MQQKDERTWGTLVHLGGIIGMTVTGLVGNIIGALLFWLIKRNESAFVDDQGKEALNFQITLSFVNLAISLLAAMRWGFAAFRGFFTDRPLHFSDFNLYTGAHGIVWLLNIIFSVIAMVKANNGIAYRYPLSVRLVK